MKKLMAVGFVMLLYACASHRPSQPSVLMVGEQIRSVDVVGSMVTITTPMGQTESLRFDGTTVITRQNTRLATSELSAGQDVKIDYVQSQDGTVFAKQIVVGFYVPHCSCGANCRCPISRGCRVLRY